MDHHLPPPTSPAAGDNFTTAEELRQALLRTTLELQSTRFLANEQLLRLSHLLRVASRERDEARLHAHSLLLLLRRRRRSPPAYSSEEDESVPAAAEGLPEKGRLLEAVMRAGPLLQTLMLAGPLPEWRHPPPELQGFEIPPVVLNDGGGSGRDESPENKGVRF